MRSLPTTSLSDTPPYIAGVSIVRGQPLPVLDLGALLASGERARARRWFVTVKAGARSVIIAVDRVMGVHPIDAAALSAMPPLLGLAESSVVSSLGLRDRDLMLLLNTSRLVPPEVFEHVDGPQ